MQLFSFLSIFFPGKWDPPKTGLSPTFGSQPTSWETLVTSTDPFIQPCFSSGNLSFSSKNLWFPHSTNSNVTNLGLCLLFHYRSQNSWWWFGFFLCGLGCSTHSRKLSWLLIQDALHIFLQRAGKAKRNLLKDVVNPPHHQSDKSLLSDTRALV